VQFDAISSLIYSKDGLIDYKEFCTAMHLQDTPASKEVFEIMDQNGSGSLDFAEWCWGIFFLTQESKIGPDGEHISALISAMFKAYGVKEMYVTKQQAVMILSEANPESSNARADAIFSKEDRMQMQKRLSFTDFAISTSQQPEFLDMFPETLRALLKKVAEAKINPASPSASV
jgi:Ca2+-binding EF-hand superfamily protein